MEDLATMLEMFRRDAQPCSETSAAFVEIINLLHEIRTPNQIKPNGSSISDSPYGSNFQSRALLSNRLGMMRLRKAAATSDIKELRSCLFEALRHDIDIACALLEATPNIWIKSQTPLLCELYLDICKEAVAPEAKAVALTNLGELMDRSLSKGEIIAHPGATSEALANVFQHMHCDRINPAFANAVLLVSGPLVSTLALQYHRESAFWQFDHKLRAWGKMIADALHDSNTFDMRMAAALALKSFASAIYLTKMRGVATHPSDPSVHHEDPSFGTDASFLPFFLALYTTLIDDDEEIREVGAIATALVMSSGSSSTTPPQPLVAVDAVDALLSWLCASFGRTNEFRAYVACRLVGNPLITIDIGVQDLQSWSSPTTQFAEALQVDESLFAIEEQNLFIDEVRETERWAATFRDLPWDFDEIMDEHNPGQVKKVLIMDSSLSELCRWTEEALRVLAEQTAQHDDGPLGWASNPEAFALCHRVLMCGKVLSELLGAVSNEDTTGATLASLLDRIRATGGPSRLHGLLVSTLAENDEGEGEKLQEERVHESRE